MFVESASSKGSVANYVYSDDLVVKSSDTLSTPVPTKNAIICSKYQARQNLLAQSANVVIHHPNYIFTLQPMVYGIQVFSENIPCQVKINFLK